MVGTELEFTFLSNLESKVNRITKETLRTVLPHRKDKAKSIRITL